MPDPERPKPVPHLAPPVWNFAPGRALVLDRPRIMAVLNLTPDSFSDGGWLTTPDLGVRAAAAAIEAGADLLDLGGESTRPGATRVEADEQIRRIVPTIGAIRGVLGDQIGITVDTTLAPVARAAFEAGADALNDVAAGLEDPELLPLCARLGRGVILMHRLRPPGEDRYATAYTAPPDYLDAGGVVGTVRAFLHARSMYALSIGIAPGAIVLDPGLGFGKSVDQNLELLRATPELGTLGYPILSALSRKSFTSAAAGWPGSVPPDQRLVPTLALSLAHWTLGARLFRVHDVAEHAGALRAFARALPTFDPRY